MHSPNFRYSYTSCPIGMREVKAYSITLYRVSCGVLSLGDMILPSPMVVESEGGFTRHPHACSDATTLRPSSLSSVVEYMNNKRFGSIK